MQPGYYQEESSVEFLHNDENISINFENAAEKVYTNIILKHAGERGLTNVELRATLQEWREEAAEHHRKVMSDARFYKEHVIRHEYT